MSDFQNWVGALFGQSQKGSRDEESGRAGLRQSLDKRVELAEGRVQELRRLREEVEEAKQALRMDETRQSLRGVESRVDQLETRLSEDLGVLEEVGEEMSKAATASRRVAVTFQRAEEDLRTLEEIGKEIRSLEEDFRGVIKRVTWVEWRGIFRSVGIVTAGILMAILILFSTTTLSPLAVPAAWRTSSTELEQIRMQERIERAAHALSDEDRKRLRALLEKGEKRAKSREKELSETLGLSKGVGPRGGEQPEER